MRAHLSKLGGQGPALICIHGFGSDSLSWTGLVGSLSTQFTLYGLDLPAHGKAENELGEPNLEAIAKAAIVACHGIEKPFDILAHSLGGAVALEMARLEPEAISSLTLLAPLGLGGAVNLDFVEGFVEAESAEALRPLLLQLVSREALIQAPMIDYTLASLEQDGRRDSLRKLAEMMKAGVELARPEGIPVTLIWGEEDKIIALPEDVELHRLPNIGHMPHVEAASKVSRIFKGSR